MPIRVMRPIMGAFQPGGRARGSKFAMRAWFRCATLLAVVAVYTLTPAGAGAAFRTDTMGDEARTEAGAQSMPVGVEGTDGEAVRAATFSNGAGEFRLGRRLLSNVSDAGNEFPDDVFSESQLRGGAVVLHIVGVLYMFIALSIVVDEYFVPSLDVITEKVAWTEDVSGATCMAAGGSAPELFTSFIGVFIAKSDVGFGTIVGSAVFNVLFVIAMCAIFSKEVLQLTWWPLVRDSSYYLASLLVLVAFFYDDHIEWWEALILFLMYAGYVTLMAYNESVKRIVHRCLRRPLEEEARLSEEEKEELRQHPSRADHIVQPEQHLYLRNSVNFRAGVLRLMLTQVDPLGHGPNRFRDSRLKRAGHLIALQIRESRRGVGGSNKVSPMPGEVASPFAAAVAAFGQRPTAGPSSKAAPADQEITPGAAPASKPTAAMGDAEKESEAEATAVRATAAAGNSEGRAGTWASKRAGAANEGGAGETAVAGRESGSGSGSGSGRIEDGGGADSAQGKYGKGGKTKGGSEGEGGHSEAKGNGGDGGKKAQDGDKGRDKSGEGKEDEEGDDSVPIRFPKSWKARVTYLLLAPLTLPLFLTVPDVRRRGRRKFFVLAFALSIVWIAVFSYLMVWWATTIGDTLGIPESVMGLTFLAAGTSIPDLLSSVIVARQGFGDMAVSSSIGSNIFDVLVGLPVPWLLYTIIEGEDVLVTSSSLVSSVLILCVMLASTIAAIANARWRLSNSLAIIMFVLYVVFVAQSLLVEYDVFNYPL